MSSSPASNPPSHFVEGNRCLLILMGQRYLVTILHVTESKVRVSFPVQDFPLEGMYLNVEFHDDLGYASYESEVLDGPKGPGDGLVLARPPDAQRNRHRSSWRVPADFKATLKDHVHPRRRECAVVNISAGGLLLHTDADLEVGDNVDLAFHLPEGGAHEALGQVMHVYVPGEMHQESELVGVRFVSPDPGTHRAITQYIWRRLRQLHPNQYTQARRRSDQY